MSEVRAHPQGLREGSLQCFQAAAQLNMPCCGEAEFTPCQASFLQQVLQPVKANTDVADQNPEKIICTR